MPKGIDAEGIATNAPEFAEYLAGLHDTHHHPGYWRELVQAVAEAVMSEPGHAEADLHRIPVPTLLVGEADDWGILNQVLEMRRAIPHSELLVLNEVPGNNHVVQFSRADIVGPVVLDFLMRHAGPASTSARI